jgi:Leucine-rich repeat (LRR) protein
MSVSILETCYSIKDTTLLFLDYKSLETFPNQVCELVNLIILYLSNNYLTTLPDSISRLVNLKILCINHNNLSMVPESIGELLNLEELYLEFNNLTSLPDSISRLVNLKILSVRENLLTILPRSVLNIRNFLSVNESSYQLDNLSQECDFLIFVRLNTPLTNLPCNVKEIWISDLVTDYTKIKLPFGCVIKRF